MAGAGDADDGDAAMPKHALHRSDSGSLDKDATGKPFSDAAAAAAAADAALRVAACTADVISDLDSFEQLMLPQALLRGLGAAGYTRPSPAQSAGLPVARMGADLVLQSKSGTGKTLVYVVTILEALCWDVPVPQALVVAPTREIALQVAEVLARVATGMGGGAVHLAAGVFIGGLPIEEDQRLLRRRCHVAIGTPGRLCALLEAGSLPTKQVRQLVLDEADKLLAEGFREDIEWLASTLPKRKQVLALSATFTPALIHAAEALMRRPQRVMLCPDGVSLLGVQQFYKLLPSSGSEGADRWLRRRELKLAALRDTMRKLLFHQAVVFCNYKPDAEWLAARLSADGYPAAYMAGGQEQVDRMDTLSAVRDLQLRVIVSTDLVARGVDLRHVNFVACLDLPPDAATYMHRVGRTGRFGSRGVAVTYLADEGELATLTGYLADVAGGAVQPLPDAIPAELYAGQAVADEWDAAALDALVARSNAAGGTDAAGDSGAGDSGAGDSPGRSGAAGRVAGTLRSGAKRGDKGAMGVAADGAARRAELRQNGAGADGGSGRGSGTGADAAAAPGTPAAGGAQGRAQDAQHIGYYDANGQYWYYDVDEQSPHYDAHAAAYYAQYYAALSGVAGMHVGDGAASTATAAAGAWPGHTAAAWHAAGNGGARQGEGAAAGAQWADGAAGGVDAGGSCAGSAAAPALWRPGGDAADAPEADALPAAWLDNPWGPGPPPPPGHPLAPAAAPQQPPAMLQPGAAAVPQGDEGAAAGGGADTVCGTGYGGQSAYAAAPAAAAAATYGRASAAQPWAAMQGSVAARAGADAAPAAAAPGAGGAGAAAAASAATAPAAAAGSAVRRAASREHPFFQADAWGWFASQRASSHPPSSHGSYSSRGGPYSSHAPYSSHHAYSSHESAGAAQLEHVAVPRALLGRYAELEWAEWLRSFRAWQALALHSGGSSSGSDLTSAAAAAAASAQQASSAAHPYAVGAAFAAPAATAPAGQAHAHAAHYASADWAAYYAAHYGGSHGAHPANGISTAPYAAATPGAAAATSPAPTCSSAAGPGSSGAGTPPRGAGGVLPGLEAARRAGVQGVAGEQPPAPCLDAAQCLDADDPDSITL